MQPPHFAWDVIEGPVKRFHEVKKFKIPSGEINSAKRDKYFVSDLSDYQLSMLIEKLWWLAKTIIPYYDGEWEMGLVKNVIFSFRTKMPGYDLRKTEVVFLWLELSQW